MDQAKLYKHCTVLPPEGSLPNYFDRLAAEFKSGEDVVKELDKMALVPL